MPSLRWRALRVNPNRINVQSAERDAIAYVETFLNRLVDQVRTYPPSKPNSTYVRTGNLGRGWQVNVTRTRTAVQGTVTNRAVDRKSGRRYMQFVQGQLQTAMHRQTGWSNIYDARVSLQRAYVAGLQAIYNKHMRKGP